MSNSSQAFPFPVKKVTRLLSGLVLVFLLQFPLLAESAVGTGTLLVDTDSGVVALPLVEIDLKLRVTGTVARAVFTQHFRNPGKEGVDAVYVFPLAETSAVDSLRLVVGQRIIEGQIQEKQQARKTYEDARRSGQKASLVEQKRPNIFTTSVANIGPGEEVTVSIGFQQNLDLDAGRYSLRFPLVIAPRYRETVDVLARSAESHGPDQAPALDQSSVAHPDTDYEIQVKLEVELDAGFPLEWIRSPSHAIAAQGGRLGSLSVVPAGHLTADRDFVLEWKPLQTASPQATLFLERWHDDFYGLLYVLPPAEKFTPVIRLNRDLIFVIDTSGSMAGTSLRGAKRALQEALFRLEPTDRFNIIQFNSQTEALFQAGTREASAANLKQASGWVDRLQANGGTEMMPALQMALAAPPSEAHVRQIIFLTDGAVGNGEALFSYIRNRIGSSQLFTVGIGSAPNSNFMRRAAAMGRGTFTYISNPEEVAEKIAELLNKLENPVVRELAVDWGDAEVWPERMPDLYAGQPLVLAARFKDSDRQILIRGLLDNGDYWEESLTVRPVAEERGIHRIWARKKIASLMDLRYQGVEAAAIRKAVLEVALFHELVSPFTSLVAVDVTPSASPGLNPERAIRRQLPQGWVHEKVFGVLPAGATSGPLHFWVGIWFLATAAALCLWRRLRES